MSYSGFIDIQALPEAARILGRLQAAHEAIADEGARAGWLFSQSPEIYIQDADDVRLYILPLKWQGRMADEIEQMPELANADWRPRASGTQMVQAAPTAAAILADEPAVVNALYSVSLPGCEIHPHADGEDSIGPVLRAHVGLRCPGEGCALHVGDEIKAWQTGEALLFDSPRTRHHAYNRTGWPRMILIVDLDREVLERSAACDATDSLWEDCR